MANQPTPMNATMFQGFEWYIAPDGKHWRRLARDIPKLAKLGITAIWIPPACKAQNEQDMGYGIYGFSFAQLTSIDTRLVGLGRIRSKRKKNEMGCPG
jgi:hypothetical protein